ncbi:hypothetical protein D9M70_636300 [compost metagenome]
MIEIANGQGVERLRRIESDHRDVAVDLELNSHADALLVRQRTPVCAGYWWLVEQQEHAPPPPASGGSAGAACQSLQGVEMAALQGILCGTLR